MRYTFRQIEYFVAAGDTLSITLASEKVHISQPAISAAISHLEAEFGIQLFIRHHAQGLSLTPEGMRFLREARSLLAHADELQGVARELSDTVSGQLEVACLVTLYPLLVPELLHDFRRRFRQTQVHAVPGNQAEVFTALRQGEVSLALTYDMDLPADITIEPLAPLPPIVFVAGSHPAAWLRAATATRSATSGRATRHRSTAGGSPISFSTTIRRRCRSALPRCAAPVATSWRTPSSSPTASLSVPTAFRGWSDARRPAGLTAESTARVSAFCESGY
jgi:DNA-binding transcriptional LysR family regulator